MRRIFRTDRSERITIPKQAYYSRVILLILGSTLFLFTLRFQDVFPSDLLGKVKKYNHPLFQAAVIHGSMAACFWLYLVIRDPHQERLEWRRYGRGFSFKWRIFVVPSILSVISTLSTLTGLLIIPELQLLPLCSVFSLSLGFIIGSVWLKKIFRLHQYIGLMMVFVAIACSAVWKAISYKDSYSPETPFARGVVLLIFSQLVIAVNYHLLERIFSKYSIPTMLACGLQGMISWVIIVVITFVANMLPCKATGLCSEGTLSSTGDAFRELLDYPILMILMVIVLMMAAVYFYQIMYILQSSSAMSVLISLAMRTVLVWSVHVMLSYKDFDPVTFIFLFALMIPGFLIYMEIVKIPWSCYLPRRVAQARTSSPLVLSSRGSEGFWDRSNDNSFRLLIEGTESWYSWDSERILCSLQDSQIPSTKSFNANEEMTEQK